MSRPDPIVVKISGEAFGGGGKIFNQDKINHLASEVASIARKRDIAIVVGGGNIARGSEIRQFIQKREEADYLGMLSTVYNAMALKNILTKKKINSAVLSELRVDKITAPYSVDSCKRLFREGKIAIVACGTGKPFVTTDTAAALRALELKADILIKGTKVKGVYSRDPVKFKNARFFPSLSFKEVLKGNYGICDAKAVELLVGSKIKFVILDIFRKGNLLKAVSGENPGTIIKEEAL